LDINIQLFTQFNASAGTDFFAVPVEQQLLSLFLRKSFLMMLEQEDQSLLRGQFNTPASPSRTMIRLAKRFRNPLRHGCSLVSIESNRHRMPVVCPCQRNERSAGGEEAIDRDLPQARCKSWITSERVQR